MVRLLFRGSIQLDTQSGNYSSLQERGGRGESGTYKPISTEKAKHNVNTLYNYTALPPGTSTMLLCNKLPVTKKLVVTSHSLVSFALVQVLRSLKGTFLINSNKGSYYFITNRDRKREQKSEYRIVTVLVSMPPLYRSGKRAKFWLSVFSENSWLKNPLSLEAEKCLPSQFIAYYVLLGVNKLLCCPTEHTLGLYLYLLSH